MSSERDKRISRRKFMDLGVKGSAGIGLSQVLSGSLVAIDSFAADQARTVHGACYHDCPDACSWTVTARDGRITQFEASKSNPYTAGKLCDKMNRFPDDVTFHPDRVLTPLKRVGRKARLNSNM